LVPPGRQDLSGFQNASRQTIRSSHLAGAPFFGIPTNNQITYVNPAITVNSGMAPVNGLMGSRVSMARYHNADPRTSILTGLDRSKSVNQISRLVSPDRLIQQTQIPNRLSTINTSVTTLNQSKPHIHTTKTYNQLFCRYPSSLELLMKQLQRLHHHRL
jgi:hypothetical protein